MAVDTVVHRCTVSPKTPWGPRAQALAEDARALGLVRVRAVERADLYFVRGACTPGELELLGRFLLSDPVVQRFEWERAGSGTREDGSGTDGPPVGPGPGGETFSRIETALRPGVSDPVASEILRAAVELGIPGIEAVSTGERFDIASDGMDDRELGLLADRLLANPVIRRWAIGRIEPVFPFGASGSGEIRTFPLALMDDAALAALSAERRSALDARELTAMRDHFRMEGRGCTDVEFEMIAQTWSEHCVHKTFRALVEVREPVTGTGGPADSCVAASDGVAANDGVARDGPDSLDTASPRCRPYPPVVDNILKSYIKKATDEIAAPWVLSAFVDNAGIVEFDDEYEISFKVETHNHPSAVEPFGGANTGVGGVIRDILGVSARPVAATDVLCFGPPDTPPGSLARGVLHPRRVFAGVVAGVQDYGNKMGIPTVNGGIRFDPGYTANPLVFCGCAGIAPRGGHPREPRVGDRIVVIGGRTGRDGIRGATFSSMVMDAATGDIAGASVQIGDPVVQKKVSEVLLEARDRRLYTAVTDCGAGGLSSAVGEMAASLGAEVDILLVPLKYPGLAPWEIWLSEAQERMVLAVPPAGIEEFASLCAGNDVGMTDLGAFTGTGRLVVRHGPTVVVDLDCGFLHDGIPQRRLVASPPAGRKPGPPVPRNPALGSAAPDGDGGAAASPRQAPMVPRPRDALLSLLSHPAIASKESVVRRYDHEVQGATVLRPYDGPCGDAPSDACVLKPRETKDNRGIALSNGFNPGLGKLDPYLMAISVLDESVRNAVAAGADPDRIAVLDNFCWGDPLVPTTMWALLEAARGCHDGAIALGTPFISGKDSFNNEYLDPEGGRVSIPPSLLVSAIGIVPDIAAVPGSDLKRPGDPLYLAGSFHPVFGASVYAELFGSPGEEQAALPGAPGKAREVYRAVHRAIRTGCVLAAHDLSEGGLAVAVAEMCLGGRIGARLGAELPFTTAALFGETNGCIVLEIAAEREPEFIALMGTLPLLRIGETGGTFLVPGDTQAGTDPHRRDPADPGLSVEELARAFHAAFDRCCPAPDAGTAGGAV